MPRHYSRSDLQTLSQKGLGAELPAPRKRKRDNEEWRIQASCFAWWRSYCRTAGIAECLFFHVPNGSMLGDSSRNRAIRAKMLKMAGMVNGVADALFLYPWRGYSGLVVEFKTSRGMMSDDQHVFRTAVETQNYRHEVCYSLEQFNEIVMDYLKP